MRERNGNDRGHHDISDREPPRRKERKEDNHDGACESHGMLAMETAFMGGDGGRCNGNCQNGAS